MSPCKLLYVQVDTHVIHEALNALEVNSKLGRWNSHCKYLLCVVACYLVSILLLKCLDDLIIPASIFSIIPKLFRNNSRIAFAIKCPKIVPA